MPKKQADPGSDMKSIAPVPQDHPSEQPQTDEGGNNSEHAIQPVQVDEPLSSGSLSQDRAQKDGGEAEPLNKILARRAALIAKPLEKEETGEKIELVIFQIGKELYGLDVQCILDIHPCKKISHLPRVPQWITGLTNLGGHILAVFDLQSFFGLTPPETQNGDAPASSYLIRIASQDLELALRVDEVLAIEVLPTSKIQEKTDVTRNLPPEYVRGVYHRNSAEHPLVLILDLANLLADPRLIIQEEAL
jgi:purine-binding chemotaxis protein CheW